MKIYSSLLAALALILSALAAKQTPLIKPLTVKKTIHCHDFLSYVRFH